eukprot:1393760-Amphidinium_carterae.1
MQRKDAQLPGMRAGHCPATHGSSAVCVPPRAEANPGLSGELGNWDTNSASRRGHADGQHGSVECRSSKQDKATACAAGP